MKQRLRQFFTASRALCTRKNVRNLLLLLLFSAALNFVVECFARRSIDSTFVFLFTRPLPFFAGTLILFFCFSIALLTKKRKFWLFLAAATWFVLAAVDFILLTYRSMPLTAADIFLIPSVRDIVEKYLPSFALLLLLLFIAALIALLFFVWYRTEKRKSILPISLPNVIVCGLLLLCVLPLLRGIGAISTAFDSLPEAYDENGFVYSFSASLFSRGVEKPEDYSPEAVDEVLNAQKNLPETADNTPNLIFVQLESFFDANYLQGVTLSENPTPNFQALKERYTNGLLSVPCIGAGTANTEFEVLTGMNLSHFGLGEYPYTTIVNTSAIQSLATALTDIGYSAHALHNNSATFYDRHIVYSNLGFNSFISLEYMDNVTYNPLNWADDSVLTEEILKSLQSTEGLDFVFSVSVQPHGRYPAEPLEGAVVLPVTGMEDDMARKNGLEYYLQQLKECDEFVGELVQALEQYDERTVVVFYGDHLPSFNFTQDELSRGDVQTTEYVLWSNFPMKREERTLQTYQLAAYALDRCGIHEGLVFRLHQSHGYDSESNQSYMTALSLLEYDILYGEGYIGEDEAPSAMRYDVEDIIFDGVEPDGQDVYFSGDHFTPFSIVYLNELPLETEYISPERLCVRRLTLSDGDELCVAQVSASDNLEILSQTAALSYHIEEDFHDRIRTPAGTFPQRPFRNRGGRHHNT